MENSKEKGYSKLSSTKRSAIVVSLIIIVIIAAVFGYGAYYYYTRTLSLYSRVRSDLEHEMQAIAPLPDATLITTTNHFPLSSEANIGRLYFTRLTYEQIRTHYDKELTARNWKFRGEESMTEWGKDLGGKYVFYCKGDYKASIQFAGEHSEVTWTFAFNLTWNGVPTCG
jgi:hypothetical protein